MTNLYDSGRLATAYAFDRPPVHSLILKTVRRPRRASMALDVGCGAGLSTAALEPLAEQMIGLEPVPTMLAHRTRVAPDARFVVGSAERLPFSASSFDLVSAAGSLNYTDLPSALAEIARVLTADGTLLLYDFAEGRRSPVNDALADWYASFEERFPPAPGWRPLPALDQPVAAAGLRLRSLNAFDVQISMTLDAYLRYVLSETNADQAIARGIRPDENARSWCLRTLTPVFEGGTLTVCFPSYLAVISP